MPLCGNAEWLIKINELMIEVNMNQWLKSIVKDEND